MSDLSNNESEVPAASYSNAPDAAPNNSPIINPVSHNSEVERQLKMYRYQQKFLLVLAGAVIGFFGRGLMGRSSSEATAYSGNDVNANSNMVAAAPAANQNPGQGQQAGPPAPPAMDPKIVMQKIQNEALTSTIGNKNAKASIIEFTDFQCPACLGAFTQFLPQIKEQYVKTGKAKLILVHWPLSQIHPSATMGAKAALCADKQGKFEQFHDALYNQQAQWSSLDRGDAAQAQVKKNLIKMAGDQNLNVNDFNTCFNSTQFDAGLAKNGQLAFELGAPGTPTFFINGKRMQNPQDLPTMVEEANK